MKQSGVNVTGGGGADIEGEDHSLLGNLNYNNAGHTGFMPNPFTTEGDVLYAGNNAVPSRLAANPGAIKFLSSFNNQTPEWAEVPAAGSLIFMLIDDASDIGGYKAAVSLTNYTEAAEGSVTHNNSSDEDIVQVWATAVGYPGITGLAPGIVVVHLHAERSVAGSGTLYLELYKREADTTETLLATTEDSSPLGSSPAALTFHAVIDDLISFAATDRLVFKVRVHVGAGTPNVTLYYDGDTASRIQLPTASIDATNFVPTGRTINTTAPLAGGGDLSANRTLSIPAANNSNDGYLTKEDWASFSAGGGRELLTVDTTYYVRKDGNDSNDGLTNDSGGAFLTIQHAIDVIAVLDLNMHAVTIQIGDGTYTEGLSFKAPVGLAGGAYTIQGNSGDPTAVVVSATSADALYFSGNAIPVSVKYLQLQTTTSGNGIQVAFGGKAQLTNVYFGACAEAHMRVVQGATLIIVAAYTISGGGTAHILIESNSVVIIYGSFTITVSGTPAFSAPFAYVRYGGVLILGGGVAFSGGATGTRYYIELNAVCNTGSGGSPTFFPGDSAGSTATGGQYL